MVSRCRTFHGAHSITGGPLGLIMTISICLRLGLTLLASFRLTILKTYIGLLDIVHDSSSFLSASSAALPARLALPGERKHGRSAHLIATRSLSSGMGWGGVSPQPLPSGERLVLQAERAGLRDRYPKGQDSLLAW